MSANSSRFKEVNDFNSSSEESSLIETSNAKIILKEPTTEYLTNGFDLLQACQENSEIRLKDIVKRIYCLSSSEVGPLVNFQDQAGRTPLSYACGNGNVIIIEELSKLRGLDPNLSDNEGNTPLHYAAQAGQANAVDLLLTKFEGIIDPNFRNSTGLTPLMKAALQGRSRVSKNLIIAGASPHIRDYSRNLTAIEWARLTGRHICAEVIVRAARDTQQPSLSSPPCQSPTDYSSTFPTSQSVMQLKRINSDEFSFFSHAKNTINETNSSSNWIKNKIKRAFGGSNASALPASLPTRSQSSFALTSGATICAGSLLLPSIKPLLDQQAPKVPKKFKIPTVQVTQVKR